MKEPSEFEKEIYKRHFSKGWATEVFREQGLKQPMGESFAKRQPYFERIKYYFKESINYQAGNIYNILSAEFPDRAPIDLPTTREIHNTISDLSKRKKEQVNSGANISREETEEDAI